MILEGLTPNNKLSWIFLKCLAIANHWGECYRHLVYCEYILSASLAVANFVQ